MDLQLHETAHQTEGVLMLKTFADNTNAVRCTVSNSLSAVYILLDSPGWDGVFVGERVGSTLIICHGIAIACILAVQNPMVYSCQGWCDFNQTIEISDLNWSKSGLKSADSNLDLNQQQKSQF